MIDSLITSRTRVKLLMKLFLNTENKAHLRGMEKELHESTNAIHHELNRLMKAGLLTSEQKANKRIFSANTNHPLFEDINHILRKTVGIDRIIESVTTRIGNLDAAYITGSFANGIDSETIELVLSGEHLNEEYIKILVAKAENIIHKKKIVYMVLTKDQINQFFSNVPILLIWKKDG